MGNSAFGSVGLGRALGWAPLWQRSRACAAFAPRISLTSTGQIEIISSDESWKAIEGPTRFDSLYEGEVYDARLAQDGWSSPGFDDSAWTPARRVEPPRGQLVAHQHEPVQVIETIHPVAVNEVRPGVYVYDFGVNVAGWVKCTAEGPPGTEITLVYGEQLHDDGTVNIDQVHIYAQIQTDRLILSGNGIESWEPKFSYKGYQYVHLPAESTEAVTESGRPAHEAQGVTLVGKEDGRAVYEVGSGAYLFEVKA